MNTIRTFITIALFATACNKVKENAKSAINKSGETVGKGATEFFEGVTEGVDRTLDCEIVLSPGLTQKGLGTGKFYITNDSTGGTNNLLKLYLIFDKDFQEKLLIKVTDKKGLEMARTMIPVKGQQGEAKFFDFLFDKNSQIEVKSKITIE